MRFEALVEIRRKPGIADPEGRTVETALPTLGLRNVRNVRMGRAVRLEVEADDAAAARRVVDHLCRRLLVSPVLEEGRIEIHDASAPISEPTGERRADGGEA